MWSFPFINQKLKQICNIIVECTLSFLNFAISQLVKHLPIKTVLFYFMMSQTNNKNAPQSLS